MLVPRAGTSFVQCFAWSAKRRQMCLVCRTPCAVRLGITGAEHTRSCWYLCWYLFRTVLRLVSPGNVSLARARPRTEQPNAVKCAQFALPLAQFAWVSRALNILARVGTWLVPLSYSASLGQPRQCITCPNVSLARMYHLPGLVLVLVSQTRANVPSFPYPFRSSLGYHGR